MYRSFLHRSQIYFLFRFKQTNIGAEFLEAQLKTLVNIMKLAIQLVPICVVSRFSTWASKKGYPMGPSFLPGSQPRDCAHSQPMFTFRDGETLFPPLIRTIHTPGINYYQTCAGRPVLGFKFLRFLTRLVRRFRTIFFSRFNWILRMHDALSLYQRPRLLQTTATILL